MNMSRRQKNKKKQPIDISIKFKKKTKTNPFYWSYPCRGSTNTVAITYLPNNIGVRPWLWKSSLSFK